MYRICSARSLLKIHIPITIRSTNLSNICRPSLATTHPLVKNLQFPFIAASNTATWPLATDRSKRTPDLYTYHNSADNIERILEKDGFKTWGFVIYRCTYKSDSDWEEFMRRFVWKVTHKLEFYNGLDLLKSFAPTVLEDRALFDGASTSVIREHFKQWVVTACQQEEGILPEKLEYADSGRYKFCLMVNEEALQSVINAPPVEYVNDTGFVILVNGIWVPEVMDEDEIAEYDGFPPPIDDYDPVEGCTLHDVGWMKVLYDGAEIDGWIDMCDSHGWQLHYYRPPDIGFRL